MHSGKEWALIILYYKRPYISVNKSFKQYFVVDLPDVVYGADCLRRNYPPDNDRPWMTFFSNDVLKPDVFHHSRFLGRPEFKMHFIDEKMRDVENRQEAFREIGTFIDASAIPIQYTMIRSHDDRLHIILFNHEDLLKNVVVEFILSDRIRPWAPYIALWDAEEDYLENPDEIIPVLPDKYMLAYFKENYGGDWRCR